MLEEPWVPSAKRHVWMAFFKVAGHRLVVEAPAHVEAGIDSDGLVHIDKCRTYWHKGRGN